MLSDRQKFELRSETFAGNVVLALNRLRLERSPDYAPACEYVLAELRKFHEVPAGRHAAFYVVSNPLLGYCIAFGQYSDHSFIQEEGVDLRHPSPLPPEPIPDPAPDPSMPRARSYFRPPRQTDFKASAANDR